MLKKLWRVVKAPAMKAIDKAQATFPPNRLVALLTPTVFVPASAWLSGWAATHLPGIPGLTTGEILGMEISGALAALALAYKYVDGWQKHEERTVPKRATEIVNVTQGTPAPKAVGNRGAAKP